MSNSGGVGGKSGKICTKFALRTKPRKKLGPNDTTLTGTTIFAVLCLFLFSYTFIVLFGEILVLPSKETEWCRAAQLGFPGMVKSYENPDHITNPCRYERVLYLLFLNKDECDFARRMLASVLLGAAIGFERKTSERPAGIRTMSLVCLGACYFTVSSQRAFRSSTMGWDAARVSAAIPSGVGFLGAGLIWKGSTGEKGSSDERHEVHGLTTAASVWLSAAVGVGVGGRLIIVSAYAVALIIIVLRIGPRLYFADDESYLGEEEEEEGEESDNNLSCNEEDDHEMDVSDPEEVKRLLSRSNSREDDDYLSENVRKMTETNLPHVFSAPILFHDKAIDPDEPVSQEDQDDMVYGSAASKSTFDEITSNVVYEAPLKDHSVASPSYRRRRSSGVKRERNRRYRRHRSLSPKKFLRPNFCS